ncbi:hypothetical protein [Limosilactobacillus ingluviei]|uniref:Uncharacterized protein n=1 Tax=Limosilactobacillus ingluviei DSM 15946 TaxID=1423760 RepID=A0A0R1U7B2_9LACO|nr:hypothetical protein [Limosilactobacillus ingluviei]KRL89149.1 hypothetical protein FC43_GL001876 [Limosilactobacillus ingluviei DSM 15946]
MDWFTLPTEKELYLADVISACIAEFDFDKQINRTVIKKWRPGTPEEVKQKAAHDYENIVVTAK